MITGRAGQNLVIAAARIVPNSVLISHDPVAPYGHCHVRAERPEGVDDMARLFVKCDTAPRPAEMAKFLVVHGKHKLRRHRRLPRGLEVQPDRTMAKVEVRRLDGRL